ncbi:MAG: glycosyltransferase family 2 protein [bacterium]|nr:glycosyltransferase family 2 protein [bacterium]
MSIEGRMAVPDSSSSGHGSSYVLVTAAYNEEEHIEETLKSVVAQTIVPRRWIVVSDGSTDGTDDIVSRYARDHSFIRLIRVEKAAEHCFAAKVRALDHGFDELIGEAYDFIGILDADISFEATYFEGLLAHFAGNPRLGVAGGNIIQWVDGAIVERVKDMNSVAGAVQFFRRACFEQAGRLPPLTHGGEDAAIETRARMNGWEVRTVPELEVIHQGLVGSGAGSRLRARFKWGQMNYSLGYHPLYQCARCVYRCAEKPYGLGSIAEAAGFVAQWLRSGKPEVDEELVRFLRGEQLTKLRAPIRSRQSH